MFAGVSHAISSYLFFFFNDTATTEIYTLSLHDAHPIYALTIPTLEVADVEADDVIATLATRAAAEGIEDRKSTRLNSSHVSISYAVFCLKKKKKYEQREPNIDS